MSARHAVTLWVVGWVVVAAAGATLTWAVISRAGTGVSGGLETLPSSAPTSSSSEPRPGTTLSPEPSGSGSTSSGSTSPPSSTPVVRTWQGSAGYVSAACRGSSIELTGATPSSGFTMEVDDVGPDRIRVEFENDESRTRVEAECVDGVPVFSDDHSGEA